MSVRKPEDSSFRTVMCAALAVGVTAVSMLLIRLVEQIGSFEEDSAAGLFLYWADFVAEIAVVVAVAIGGPLALREMRARSQARIDAETARSELEALFRMADMLQSAVGYSDANAVLSSTALRLLPEHGGALHVFNNSRDRLDLSTSWNWPEGDAPAEIIVTSSCWALKRGKSHVNEMASHALCCDHYDGRRPAIEIPMMARGEVYGLLSLIATDDRDATFARAKPLAYAIADAMSLALSNIALREKLRAQALRDPLTGLYNRRYMEDALDRFASMADRDGSPLTALMIDLDHFKRLNDEHGHALGDAILSETAATIINNIRPSDVACRYGGEELVVLMPDCPLEMGLARAETLRQEIERISAKYASPVSASFGVAACPETSRRIADLLQCADAALYQAKEQGRNRVVCAKPTDGLMVLQATAA